MSNAAVRVGTLRPNLASPCTAVPLVDSSTPHVYSASQALFDQPLLALELLTRFASVNKSAFKTLRTRKERTFGDRTVAVGQTLEELATRGVDDKTSTAVLEAILDELSAQSRCARLLNRASLLRPCSHNRFSAVIPSCWQWTMFNRCLPRLRTLTRHTTRSNHSRSPSLACFLNMFRGQEALYVCVPGDSSDIHLISSLCCICRRLAACCLRPRTSRLARARPWQSSSITPPPRPPTSRSVLHSSHTRMFWRVLVGSRSLPGWSGKRRSALFE